MGPKNESDGDGGLLDDLGKAFDDLHRDAQDGLRQAEDELRERTQSNSRASRLRPCQDSLDQPRSDECRKLAERIEESEKRMTRVPEGSPAWETLRKKRDQLQEAYFICLDREQSARDRV